MKKSLVVLLMLVVSFAMGQKNNGNDDTSKNLRQYYSGKFGYYHPGDGLNNGLLFGVDGITEFIHYNFSLSGAIDLYQKQTFNFFKDPQPQISQQAIILLPLHVNAGYKIFDISDADTRMFVGAGGGYYFYFYAVDYTEKSGSGSILDPIIQSSKTESKNGGKLFATVYARVLIGKIFVEPRFYFASKVEGTVSTYSYTVNPSGFAITLGFQY